MPRGRGLIKHILRPRCDMIFGGLLEREHAGDELIEKVVAISARPSAHRKLRSKLCKEIRKQGRAFAALILCPNRFVQLCVGRLKPRGETTRPLNKLVAQRI